MYERPKPNCHFPLVSSASALEAGKSAAPEMRARSGKILKGFINPRAASLGSYQIGQRIRRSGCPINRFLRGLLYDRSSGGGRADKKCNLFLLRNLARRDNETAGRG